VSVNLFPEAFLSVIKRKVLSVDHFTAIVGVIADFRLFQE
jgi:hypothetical protein